MRGRKRMVSINFVTDTLKKLIIPGWGDGNRTLVIRPVNLKHEEIDNPRMRGRKLLVAFREGWLVLEEIDNPRMRGRKLDALRVRLGLAGEEIDNPRMRGRKPATTAASLAGVAKKLIIPGWGDGNLN